jgi:hypothetical protein
MGHYGLQLVQEHIVLRLLLIVLSSSIFSTGSGVALNGKRWVSVGEGTNEIVYSRDGINWYGVPTSSSSIFTTGYGV